MMSEQQPTRSDAESDTIDGADGRPGSGAPTAAVSAPRARMPERIGHYHIKRVIASGGMGTVYEAVQEQPRRTVAVKVMKQGIASRSALRRFEYEAQILARLRHPGIAQVYEAGFHDDGFGGVPYFAMEYIAGAREIIDYAQSKEMPTRDRLLLFIEVCEAIHHGHQKGIIHRDLKPANILVDSTGQPKIIDFGVARATDSDLAVTTLQTDVGQLVGTVQYMSPEQIDADPHDIDTRSDVYALGVVLYKLLTNRLPYDVTGTVIYEATRIIREQQPTRFRTIDKSLRGDVETIVLHALEKDRDRRYQSALELAHDIRRYLDNRTITARPPSIAYQFRTFVRRNSILVGGIAAVFAALVLGTIGTASGWRAEKSQRQVAERRFDQVRQLANTFMFDFHDAIQKLDGSLPARTLVVENALEYLDGLAKDAGDDPGLLAELAMGYDRVGDIRGGTRNPGGTDTAGALEQYRTALRLRQTLVDAAPKDRRLRRDLANSHIKVGDMLEKSGQVAAALGEYQTAADICEDLVASDASDTDGRRRLAIALDNLGVASKKNGDLAAARRHFERSLGLRQGIAREHPLRDGDERPLREKKLQYQRDLSVAYMSLGGHLYDMGDYEGALSPLHEAIRIRELILENEPDSGRAGRDLAIARFFAGRAYLELGRREEAMQNLEFFLNAAQQRRQKSPTDARAQSDLAAAHTIVGRAEALLGDPDAARGHFEQAQEILGPLAASDPVNTFYRELIAENMRCAGELATEHGRMPDALRSLREALATVEQLAADDPDNAGLRDELARIQARLGAALVRGGDLGEARQRLDAAREHFAGMLQARPEDARLRGELTETLRSLSALAAAAGDGATAQRYAQDAIATAPGGPTPRLYRALAEAAYVAGDRAGAADAARRALGRLEQESEGPRTAALRRDLEADLLRYGQD
jgi:serine/threonine protein kinase